ncbi:MAG: hypothetical protein ACI9PN_002699, partial [Candidatus Azotimanducaceae bacterium]
PADKSALESSLNLSRALSAKKLPSRMLTLLAHWVGKQQYAAAGGQ